MNKSQIQKISKRLGWQYDETEKAIDELSKAHSITDIDEVIKISLKAKTPDIRYERLSEYLLNKLDGDLVQEICNLLMIDPCFRIMALFNYRDFVKVKKSGNVVGIEYQNGQKSFIKWKSFIKFKKVKSGIYYLRAPRLIDSQDLDSNTQIQLSHNPYIFAESMSYSFIDTLIHNKLESNDKDVISAESIGNLLIEIVKGVNFLAFNIKMFMDFVTQQSYQAAYGTDKILKNVLLSMSEPYYNRKAITKRTHWLIFVVACELQSRGAGVRDSFAKSGELLHIPEKSVARRFYERKKDAKKLGLSVEQIIYNNHLSLELNNLLENYRL